MLPAGVMAVALLASLLSAPTDHSVLMTAARSAAAVLLAAVSLASVQMGRRWLVFARHDSIRADIAAAGGLGKRLAV